MSFPVPISQLTQEERDRIVKELEIIPVAPQSAGAKFHGKGVVQQASTPPFNFFISERESGNLKIPLSYARLMFGPELVPGESDQWKSLSGDFARGIDSVRVPLRPHQIGIVEEARERLSNHSTTLIQVPPGTGKTIMAIVIAVCLGLKFAVLFPRSTLQTQWVKSIARVLLGGDGDAEMKIASTFICEPSQASVEARTQSKGTKAVTLDAFQAIVVLGERATAIPREMRTQIGTLIVDEAHLCCVPSLVPALLAFSPRYIISLTATLERQDGAHQMIHHLSGQYEVFRKPTRPFKVVAFQTGVPIKESLNRITKLLDYTQYCSDLAASDEFSSKIVEIVSSAPFRKFVILFTRVDHAERVSAAIREAGVSSEVMCGTRKKYTDCRALCGTFGKISTGFDASTFATDFDGDDPDTLILVNGVKQTATFAQSAGRIMRAPKGVTPTVVWMLTQNAVSTRHLSGMRKYIIETSGEIIRTTSVAAVSKALSESFSADDKRVPHLLK